MIYRGSYSHQILWIRKPEPVSRPLHADHLFWEPRNFTMRDVVAPPISRIGSPASRWRSASLIWCGVIFGGRPIFTPRAMARLRPSPVLVRISSRSNSARPPRTVKLSRPRALVVSAHVSPSDRKPAFRSVIVARVFSRSALSGPNRRAWSPSAHHRPRAGQAPCEADCGRLWCRWQFPRSTLLHPAWVSWRTGASTLWPSVETRAYPNFMLLICTSLTHRKAV